MATTSVPEQSVMDTLLAVAGRAPLADMGLSSRLRTFMKDRVAPFEAAAKTASATSTVWLRKELLSDIHACEEYFVLSYSNPWPGWTVSTARGQVAHVAVRLLCAGLYGEPGDLVTAAIERIIDDGDAGLSEFLQGLSDAARADLASQAAMPVAAFVDQYATGSGRSWPEPIAEYPVKVNLFGGNVVVSGKVDLAFGRPKHTEGGVERGRVLLELKTGGAYPQEHRHDSLLYGLLDTLKTNVSPAAVATWYLDSNDVLVDELDEEVLMAAAARTADGVGKAVDLLAGTRTATRRGGWRCRFCPAAAECPEAV